MGLANDNTTPSNASSRSFSKVSSGCILSMSLFACVSSLHNRALCVVLNAVRTRPAMWATSCFAALAALAIHESYR